MKSSVLGTSMAIMSGDCGPQPSVDDGIMKISATSLSDFQVSTDVGDNGIYFPFLVTVSSSFTVSLSTTIAYITALLLSDTPGATITISQNSVLNDLNIFATMTTVSGIQIDQNALTSITMPVLTAAETIDIAAENSLTSVSCPLLVTVGEFGGALRFATNPVLVTLNLPLYEGQLAGGALTITDNVTLATVSLPAFIDANFITVTGNTALTSWSFPNFTWTNVGSGLNFSGNALNAASINHILARAVLTTEPDLTGVTIDLSGGTNAAPTGQGLVDKAALEAKNCTVLTN